MRILIKIQLPGKSKPDTFILNDSERAGDVASHLAQSCALPSRDAGSAVLHYWLESQGTVLDPNRTMAENGIGNSASVCLCRGKSPPETRSHGPIPYEGKFEKI